MKTKEILELLEIYPVIIEVRLEICISMSGQTEIRERLIKNYPDNTSVVFTQVGSKNEQGIKLHSIINLSEKNTIFNKLKCFIGTKHKPSKQGKYLDKSGNYTYKWKCKICGALLGLPHMTDEYIKKNCPIPPPPPPGRTIIGDIDERTDEIKKMQEKALFARIDGYFYGAVVAVCLSIIYGIYELTKYLLF